MKELITKKVLDKSWTFTAISNLKPTIEELSEEVYSEMKVIDRVKAIRDYKINEHFVGMSFEEVFRTMTMTHIKGEVAETIRIMLEKATINFGGNNNEISERSMGGESHKERTADEKKDSLVEE